MTTTIASLGESGAGARCWPCLEPPGPPSWPAPPSVARAPAHRPAPRQRHRFPPRHLCWPRSPQPSSRVRRPRAPNRAPRPARPPSTAATATDTVPLCVVTPELTEGPYVVDERLNRSDIRSDPTTGAVKEGIPPQLTLRVWQVSSAGCTPLQGAMVDIWHCDALGVYSDVADPVQHARAEVPARVPGDRRGRHGAVHHYPPWLVPGARGPHSLQSPECSRRDPEPRVHLAVLLRRGPDRSGSRARLYASKGQRTTRNEDDSIYRQSGGQLTLALVPSGEGYVTTFDIGLQLT